MVTVYTPNPTEYPMKRLKEKVALITGSALGIGEATARLSAAEGATVAMTDIQDKRGMKIAKEIGADYLRVDVSKETDVVKAVDYVIEHNGRLDCMRALALEDISFVNGHALVVDGGVTGGRMWSDYCWR